jgi:hypothetical protein
MVFCALLAFLLLVVGCESLLRRTLFWSTVAREEMAHKWGLTLFHTRTPCPPHTAGCRVLVRSYPIVPCVCCTAVCRLAYFVWK